MAGPETQTGEHWGTDRQLAWSGPEFAWDHAHESEVHRHVAAPVLDRLARAGARSVLDLGCGNGAFTRRMHAAGLEVVGLDASRSGIALARSQADGPQFEPGDLGTPLDRRWHGRFDAVVAIEVIEHLWLPRRLFEAAGQALRPGGLLLVSTPFHGYWKNLALALTGGFDRHWHPLRDHGHVKFFSRATLGRLFEEHGYTQLQFATVGRVPPLARSMLMSGRRP